MAALLVYASVALVSGKTIKAPVGAVVTASLFVLFAFCLAHTITAAVAGIPYEGYGAYLGDCFAAGEGGFASSTAGGALCGLIVYPVVRPDHGRRRLYHLLAVRARGGVLPVRRPARRHRFRPARPARQDSARRIIARREAPSASAGSYAGEASAAPVQPPADGGPVLSAGRGAAAAAARPARGSRSSRPPRTIRSSPCRGWRSPRRTAICMSGMMRSASRPAANCGRNPAASGRSAARAKRRRSSRPKSACIASCIPTARCPSSAASSSPSGRLPRRAVPPPRRSPRRTVTSKTVSTTRVPTSTIQRAAPFRASSIRRISATRAASWKGTNFPALALPSRSRSTRRCSSSPNRRRRRRRSRRSSRRPSRRCSGTPRRTLPKRS